MSDRDGTDRDGSFLDRLGELVITSFATGQSVEGSWYLVSGHLMVPNVNVQVARIDGRRSSASDERTVSGTDPRPFEAKLESFVLSEYAAGEQLAGTWELRYGRGALPAWEVSIELGEGGSDGVADEFPLRTAGER